MNRPPLAANGVDEPELLTKFPPAATTMALPVAVLEMDEPLFKVILPIAFARKSPLVVSVPPMVMPAFVPLVLALTDAAVMEGSVRALVESIVTLLSAVVPPIAPPKLKMSAVAFRL